MSCWGLLKALLPPASLPGPSHTALHGEWLSHREAHLHLHPQAQRSVPPALNLNGAAHAKQLEVDAKLKGSAADSGRSLGTVCARPSGKALRASLLLSPLLASHLVSVSTDPPRAWVALETASPVRTGDLPGQQLGLLFPAPRLVPETKRKELSRPVYLPRSTAVRGTSGGSCWRQ